MHSGVSSNHEMSQKKLKGIPTTVGYTRSHRLTEKQTAVNGISPNSIDPSAGRFTGAPPRRSEFARECTRTPSPRQDASRPGAPSGAPRAAHPDASLGADFCKAVPPKG